MSLTDQERRMMQRMENSIAATPTQAQIEALISALEPFAKIEIPPNADDGTWVAKTLFCNNQITAFQVRQARAACNAKISFDAAIRALKD